MRTRPQSHYRQSGVIPIRIGEQGPEVLLVTTRGRGRWTIPKGVIAAGRTAIDSALNEAYEEAGVRGDARPVSIGQYRYHKWGGECVVEVFVLEVHQTLTQWPEARERKRRWMSIPDAVRSIRNAELAMMIGSLAAVYSPSSSSPTS